MPNSASRRLPRNLRVLSWTSLLTDLSSEMVLRLLPLYLSSVLGVRVNVIGLIEGVAESAASLLKLASGWLSDRLGRRKWLAVAGYGVSALAKPFFLGASTWAQVAAVRWTERLGKGLRTAPRDALLADSVTAERRGFSFGFHRSADTLGAFLGLALAAVVVWRLQGDAVELGRQTFHTLVWLSLLPAVAAVLVLALGAREVAAPASAFTSRPSRRGLGRQFWLYLGIVALFDLGNSADAFLVLRAAERGLSVLGVLGMLATLNVVYFLTSTPGGMLSDRFGRRRVLAGGWLLYAAVYLGLGQAENGVQVWMLAAVYGAYYGLSFGTARALVADLVPAERRGTAFGTFHATLGVIDLPASVIAGVLWQGFGSWSGFGAAAPFYFGAATAALAAVLLLVWRGGAGRTAKLAL